MKEKGHQFRVTKVPVADAPPFAKDSKVLALFALSPYSSKIIDGPTPGGKPRKAAVSVVNPDVTKLPAGSAVEFIAVGDRLLGDPFTGGLLLVVAKGKVSSDGTKIDTDAGEGLSVLTWLGVRAAP